MNVLFIRPRCDNIFHVDLPAEVDDERGCFPPLGILYVASFAREFTDANVRVLDMEAENISLEDLYIYINKYKPDVVGIQAITYSLIDTIKTAEKIKEIDRNICVVLGGIHATIYPEETVQIPQVDYVIAGEGEKPFAELIQNLDNREKLKKIRGLIFKDGGVIINNGKSETIFDLDKLPFPARDLILTEKYYSVLAKRSPLTTMITSKGCPNQCTFCDRPMMENRFRRRSAKNVVDEIEACTKLGIFEFSFYDDTFTINKKRALDICDEIIKRKLNIGWDARARVNTVDKELLLKLKQAGCERLYYGVESGDQDILKKVKKNINIEQIIKAFKLTKQAGIETLAYFMIGLPSETKEQILKTINFAKKCDADYAVFSLFTPLPATEIYDIYLKTGFYKEDYWRNFAKNPTTDFKPRVNEDNISKEELFSLLTYAYKNYYFRPKYVLKRLLKIRTIEQLKVQFKSAISLFHVKST